MNITSILSILFHANQLKQTARTGWVQRGVPDAENVAAHSYGVTFVVLLLAPLIEQPINLERALAMAVLHDLPEALTTDIPTPAWRYLPDGIKTAVERGVMQEMLAETAVSDDWMALFEELHANETPEAKLVHDADKVELYVQATVYEQQTGNQRLEEFWQTPRQFHFAPAQQIYKALLTNRS